MNPRTRALLEAPVFPTLVRLAAPNIFLAFMQALVTLGDTWFISHTGTSGLAGIVLRGIDVLIALLFDFDQSIDINALAAREAFGS
jgi:Na+-driven multidrug efflux pump